MSIQNWSLAQVALACVIWLVGYPILLIALLTQLYPKQNVGFTGITLLLLLGLWIAPPIAVGRQWRRARSR